MSSTTTRKKNKKDEDHIIHHKKEIGNGDLTKELKRTLKTTYPSKSNKNANLENKLKTLTTPMNKFEKNLTSTFKNFYSGEKIQKEKETFHKNLKKISKNQTTLKEKLANLENNSYNKNYYYSKNRHLPNTIEEIDDDIDLSRLLLKNPHKMTQEEKAFIASFTNKEFDLFIKYLQIKDKELKWQGNGYGSGHYLNTFISIYRNKKDDEKMRYRTIKNFLKTNYTSGKKKQSNMIWNEEKVSGDNIGNVDDEEDEDLVQYELQAKKMMMQLDEYKKIMSFEKDNAQLERFIKMNELIEDKLTSEKNALLQEIEDKKNRKDNTEEMYNNFMKERKIQKEKETKYFLISYKIHQYMLEYNLTCFELAKKCLESDEDPYGKNKWINIDFAMKRFKELLILNEEEAGRLNDILQKYSGSRMRIDIFADFLDSLTRIKNEEDIFKEKEEYLLSQDEDNEYSNIEDLDYDGEEFRVKPTAMEQKLKREQQEASKYLTKLDMLLREKNAVFIQKHLRRHFMQKKTKLELIYISMLVRRITKILRKNLRKAKRMEYIERGLNKIVNVFIKHYWKPKDLHKLSTITSRWLRSKKYLSYEDKKLIYVTFVQQKWREYKAIMRRKAEMRHVLDKSLLLSTICFICRANPVTYLCNECISNHYCARCFYKYHSIGEKKNHTFLFVQNYKISEDEIKKDPEIITKREIIRTYLKSNEIDLRSICNVWDFEGKNCIKYKDLKYALTMSYVKINERIVTLIMMYAKHFFVDKENYYLEGNQSDDFKKVSLNFINDLVDEDIHY